MLISVADIVYHDPMRTLIDIPDAQIAELGAVCERLKQPRAAIVRTAIAEFLARQQRPADGEAFGLWGLAAPDGLEYQRELRAEW